MDVVALGELLIDFTETGFSAQGNRLLEVNPGGAPCNVLSMLRRLGHEVAFIGKVGDDQFGHLLKKRIEEIGICSDHLIVSKEYNTTLAFVETKPDGDREFTFYRNPGADMMLSESEIPYDLLDQTRLFHFGTLSMTHDGCRAATKASVLYAQKQGKYISFDPNYRAPLWHSVELAKENIRWGLSHCQILKISDNELELLEGTSDIDAAAEAILAKHSGIRLLCATLGKDGCKMYYQGNVYKSAGVPRSDTIETTGAGDTFCACLLNFVLKEGLNDLTEEKLLRFGHFANTAAAIITTRKGALSVMPTVEEIEAQL